MSRPQSVCGMSFMHFQSMHSLPQSYHHTSLACLQDSNTYLNNFQGIITRFKLFNFCISCRLPKTWSAKNVLHKATRLIRHVESHTTMMKPLQTLQTFNWVATHPLSTHTTGINLCRRTPFAFQKLHTLRFSNFYC